MLEDLYTDQKGTVKFGVQSDEFNIERGTKQGDPVSTALFNAVLEVCMRRTKRSSEPAVQNTHTAASLSKTKKMFQMSQIRAKTINTSPISGSQTTS